MKISTTPKIIHAGVDHECEECGENISKGSEAVMRYTTGKGNRHFGSSGYEYYHLDCWDQHRAWMWGDWTVEKMRAAKAPGVK